MNELKLNSYTVKTYDNLDRIAQSLGYKSWTVIYNSEFNRNFRLKRPNPNIIQPGDTILLPPNKKDIIRHWEKKINILLAAKREYINTMDSVVNSSRNDLAKINSFGQMIDTTKTAISIISELCGIVSKGIKIMKSVVESEIELETKEITKEVLRFAYNPIAEVGLEGYSSNETISNNKITVASQVIVDGFLKMQTPSFWANTIAGMVSGKSWQEAVTESPEIVQKEIENGINGNKIRVLADIDKKINNYKKLINKLSGMMDKPLPIVESFI